MPEGPSILALRNKLQRFQGKTVVEAGGYGDMEKSALQGASLLAVEAYGKNLLFVFQDFFVGVHLGLFGRMVVNDRKKVNASFSLHFQDGEVNFYVAKTKLYPGKPQEVFDFRTDILKAEFSAVQALATLRSGFQNKMIGDVVMDQQVFAGVGNIIRSEVLYRSKIHPDSLVRDIPDKHILFLIKTTIAYAQEFLNLIKTGGVKTEAMVYGKKVCPKDKSELLVAEMGKVKRKTYVCQKCQKLYKPVTI